MNIEEQIKILRRAKTYLREGDVLGICSAIIRAENDLHGTLPSKVIISSFNYKNIVSLSQKYGFTTPVNKSGFWWRAPNVNVRLKCIDALIKEIENEKKDQC